MNTKLVAERMTKMMAEGKTLEEALQIIQSEEKVSNGKVEDRTTWIATLDNISELRNAIKIAFAKKSKSKDKPEAKARYEGEIKAGQAKLNQMLGVIAQETEGVRWIKALELGESLEGSIQWFVQDRENIVNELLEEMFSSISKAELHRKIVAQSSATSEETKERLNTVDGALDAFEKRLVANDQRVITLVKKINLTESESK